MTIEESIKALGSAVEDRWRAANYDEARLPDIAAEALTVAALHDAFSSLDILRWTLQQRSLPKQFDPRGNFGDPPITLFAAARFHIDVYFWFEGTTAIHHHSFCGAFQVLQGSSLHSVYDFEEQMPVNAHMKIGRMRLRQSELLNEGMVQPIVAGREYIHSLFHLEYPSVTLIVRTTNSPLELPQFEYHKPGLALNTFYDDECNTRRLQVLSALARIEPEDLDTLIQQTIESNDVQSVYYILAELNKYSTSNQLAEIFSVTTNETRFGNALSCFEQKEPVIGKVYREVFAAREKINAVLKVRRLVTSGELRFFLALLLNVDDKALINKLIGDRFPESNPKVKILDWVYELSTIRHARVGGENMLGIIGFDDLDLFLVEELMEGKNEVEIAEAIRSSFVAERAASLLPDLDQRIGKIRECHLLRPLLL